MRKKSYVARAQSFIRSFAPYLKESDYMKAVDAASEYSRLHSPVSVKTGVNRIVFLHNDFVVKIDKKHMALPTFGGCKAEMRMWEKAIADGAEKWFAPIHHYEYNNRDWYIMPRAELLFRSDAFDDDDEDVRNWLNEIGDEQYYYYEDNVEDLHNENVGTLNGRIVAIDYAATMA